MTGAASPAPLPLNRAGRLAARQLPGWTIRYLPATVAGRRWRAQPRRPLTRAARMAAFLATARRWRR